MACRIRISVRPRWIAPVLPANRFTSYPCREASRSTSALLPRVWRRKKDGERERKKKQEAVRVYTQTPMKVRQACEIFVYTAAVWAPRTRIKSLIEFSAVAHRIQRLGSILVSFGSVLLTIFHSTLAHNMRRFGDQSCQDLCVILSGSWSDP